MSTQPAPPTDSKRKLFFGLFIFPLVIAVGMALILCTVVFLTTERQTPESLIASIKSGPKSSRWQKAFELSNELNQKKDILRNQALVQEMASLLNDPANHDEKTRSYIAIALSRFDRTLAEPILADALKTSENSVQAYILWSLGSMGAKGQEHNIRPFLNSESLELQQMAIYVLGAIGAKDSNDLIENFLKHKDQNLRWNAALALARLGNEKALPEIQAMLSRNALATEHQMDEARIESLMINAMKGLILIPNKDSIKILQSLASQDKSLKVRQIAFESIDFLRRKGFE